MLWCQWDDELQRYEQSSEDVPDGGSKSNGCGYAGNLLSKMLSAFELFEAVR